MMSLGSMDAWISVAGYAAFFVLLARLSFDDVRIGLLYDRWVLALAFVGILMAASGQLASPLYALSGALVGGGLLYVVRLLSRGGMGGGDVKLAAALGIWTGLDGILPALFVAFVLGSMFGVVQMILHRQRHMKLSFGPFLAVGGIVGTFFGEELVRLYEAWFW